MLLCLPWRMGGGWRLLLPEGFSTQLGIGGWGARLQVRSLAGEGAIVMRIGRGGRRRRREKEGKSRGSSLTKTPKQHHPGAFLLKV